MTPRSFRQMSFTLLAVLVLPLLAALPGAAGAQHPAGREWTRLTATTGKNIEEAVAARTSDGTLHVLWLRKHGANLDLMHTALDPQGHVAGPPSTVLDNWAGITNPALVVEGGKLRALFGGQRSLASNDPYSGGSLYTAVSGDSGATWTLQPGAHAASTSVYASPTAATVSKDGTVVSAWAISFALDAHVGLDPHQHDLILDKRCCAYQPALATDAQSGQVVLAWYSNVSKANGLYAETLLPAQGSAVYVPGSATETRTDSLSADQRVGLAARRGAGGVYVGYCSGYPTCRTVNVWRYEAAEPMVVEHASGARLVNLTAGPEGRLWVMWMRSGHLYAARSNRAATRFGRAVTVVPPRGTSSIWKVGGEGSLGPLDLLASMSVASQGLATWHTRVLPPLSLSAHPSHFKAAEGAKVEFVVSDVGDPVAGAEISVAGHTLSSDAHGRAFMTFPKGAKPATVTARASMKDYSGATAHITSTAK